MVFEASTAQKEPVLSVAQLNRQVGQMLESHFCRIWVRGEISNFTQAASGHWYFSIKDSQAAVRAVMFRSRAQAVGFLPRAGESFEFRANVTLYEPRGEYQLQIEALRRIGRGDLHEAFLALKEKLAAEGLFDAARKREIPAYPRRIGVITSLAAAALRDVLTALARRAPHVPVVLYPAPVQGAAAAGQLLDALQQAIRRADADVLLLVRGGGSIEDLWSFNDERLARAVAASPIPVICGVGHETDFTIADFAADLRAPTPTAAAELACRSRDGCLDQVQAAFAALTRHHMRFRERAAMRLDRAVAGLVSPAERLRRQGERLQALSARLMRVGAAHDARRSRLAMVQARLDHAQPRVPLLRSALAHHDARLAVAAARLLAARRHRLDAAMASLRALNPRNVLGRGYAIVRNAHGGVVKNALDLSVGDDLDVELDRGCAQMRVSAVRPLL